MSDLTEDDRLMLGLEKKMPRASGPKEAAIRDLFDCNATRYYQRLNALIDREEALAHDPVTVNRLRRLRQRRRGQRARLRNAS